MRCPVRKNEEKRIKKYLMLWILLNCKFSYFEIKVFKISRTIEDVKPQFVNLFQILNISEFERGEKNSK